MKYYQYMSSVSPSNSKLNTSIRWYQNNLAKARGKYMYISAFKGDANLLEGFGALLFLLFLFGFVLFFMVGPTGRPSSLGLTFSVSPIIPARLASMFAMSTSESRQYRLFMIRLMCSWHFVLIFDAVHEDFSSSPGFGSGVGGAVALAWSTSSWPTLSGETSDFRVSIVLSNVKYGEFLKVSAILSQPKSCNMVMQASMCLHGQCDFSQSGHEQLGKLPLISRRYMLLLSTLWTVTCLPSPTLMLSAGMGWHLGGRRLTQCSTNFLGLLWRNGGTKALYLRYESRLLMLYSVYLKME